MDEERRAQLEYSSSQALMLDLGSRQAKARKIAGVLKHHLGRPDLDGLDILDVGCSGGIIASSLAEQGARVQGVDIDGPGLAHARRLGVSVSAGDGDCLPYADASFDVVISNHVYEHTVSAEAMVAELGRVLRRSGIAFLGLGNRWGVMEPHYRLPFLSWLPRPLAHRYLRRARRIDHYHEQFRSRRQLIRLFGRWTIWDYTLAVIADPDHFEASDVPTMAKRLPSPGVRLLVPVLPTYLWVAALNEADQPRGERLRVPPRRLQIGV
jgi:2-polyprenyl-3-methyl-5-hydroxy-6-metoxy-1,4-benzoquinol methylase